MSQDVSSLFHYEDLFSKVKNKNKRTLDPSSVKLSLHAKHPSSGQLTERMILMMRVRNKGLEMSLRQILSTKGSLNKTRHNLLLSGELLGVSFLVSSTVHLSLMLLFSNVPRPMSITEFPFVLSEETNAK